ncbi:P-loop containing nucleoside triphosphate hydrolase protein [Lipomyces tetrasporus]|uniref:RNA helicase n=1 Tax=Lipomyces tetrasporus TaxID=54092 RepID=A0AAD7QSX2_9ASCO|nr:P-loop containing nucleoside triphosphate hydrolase protein [Lipomyces tetrasporus]KAJ8100726.1 P-loop containing nucleoside triphosphate hydrolase protein [Lipomyces tetrasporus]
MANRLPVTQALLCRRPVCHICSYAHPANKYEVHRRLFHTSNVWSRSGGQVKKRKSRQDYNSYKLSPTGHGSLRPAPADHVPSYGDFMNLLRSRLLNLRLRSTKQSLMAKFNIHAEMYDQYLEAYCELVRQLPENQYYALHAPDYQDYMTDRPIIPHLGILCKIQRATDSKMSAIVQIDNMLNVCYVNFLQEKETLSSRTPIIARKSRQLANMDRPEEWYPHTRGMKRKWILHVGPTNSGKTYTALQRLQNANTGIFAGPLRLLAREIYERFKAAGKACNLVTGEEIIMEFDEFGNRAGLSASTVEMVDQVNEVDVAVIDEIQMICDPLRGWAWTAAVLGLKAKELHLCGEERAVGLLLSLAESVGDAVVVNRYKRLSPLEVEKHSLTSSVDKIRPGDAIVTFSRQSIFAIKRKIENETQHKSAIIYGGLPPETRARQAQLFNDPNSGFDVLVASDAIGMGLNLSIKRIVFESATKFDGLSYRRVEPNHMKQIAGRAGRYRSSFETANGTQISDADRLGLVTTLDKEDHGYLVRCMARDAVPITHAGVLPHGNLVRRFAQEYPPSMPFDILLTKFYNLATASSNYVTCSLQQQISVARMISEVGGLLVNEKTAIVTAPANSRVGIIALIMEEMCKAIARGTPISLVDIEHFDLDAIEYADVSKPYTLKNLEQLHLSITLYLWLSYRFPVILFDREGAMELNVYVQALIEKCLNTIQFKRVIRNYVDDDEIMSETEVESPTVPDAPPQFSFKSRFGSQSA